MTQPVIVTGIGTITPIGAGSDGVWSGVLHGRSAMRRITRFDPEPFQSQFAAEITDFDPLDYIEARRARRLDSGWLSPTANLVHPEPDRAVHHVPNGGLDAVAPYAIANSFGSSGGIDGSLMLGRWDGGE